MSAAPPPTPPPPSDPPPDPPRSAPSPPAPGDGSADQPAAASSSRTAIAVIGALVVLGIGMVALNGMLDEQAATEVAGGEEGADGAPVRCDPSPDGAPALGGLEVPEGPDAIAPGVLCGFEDDSSVPITDLLGGQPLVLNFWATWCEPCRAEMPDFQEVHEAADGAFRLVGINHQDAPGLARDFVAELGITYDMVRDPSGRYLPANGGFGMPTTLFVEPDGTIAYRQTGPMDAEQFVELLAEELAVEVTVNAR